MSVCTRVLHIPDDIPASSCAVNGQLPPGVADIVSALAIFLVARTRVHWSRICMWMSVLRNALQKLHGVLISCTYTNLSHTPSTAFPAMNIINAPQPGHLLAFSKTVCVGNKTRNEWNSSHPLLLGGHLDNGGVRGSTMESVVPFQCLLEEAGVGFVHACDSRREGFV